MLARARVVSGKRDAQPHHQQQRQQQQRQQQQHRHDDYDALQQQQRQSRSSPAFPSRSAADLKYEARKMILEKRQQQHSHQQGMPQLGQDNHSATARGDDLEDAVCALAGKYLLPPAVQSTAGGGQGT